MNNKILPSITIGVYKKYLEPYLKALEVHSRKESTLAALRNDLKLFLYFLKANKIRRIYIDMMNDFASYLRTDRENNDGAINRKLCSCKTYFKYIAAKPDHGAGDLPLNGMLRMKIHHNSATKTIRCEEVQRLIEVIDCTTKNGIRDRMLYGLIYNIGLRVSEVEGINLKDIDFKEKKLTVTGKGCKVRTVPMSKETLKAIKNYLPFRSEFRNSNTEDALFLSKRGQRLAVRTIQDNFRKYRMRAGKLSLEKVTPHSLRHAFASHWIDSGCSKMELKAILGHAKMDTTDQYIHPSLDVQRKALENHPGNKLIESYIKSNNLAIKFYTFKKSKDNSICPHCMTCLNPTEPERMHA